MKTITQHCQLKALKLQAQCFDLPVLAGLASPYFTGRDINLTNQKMTVKYVLQEWIANGNGQFFAYGDFQDIDTNTFLSTFFTSINAYDYDDVPSMRAAGYAAIVAQAITLGYSTFATTDILDISAGITPPAATQSPATRSIVTGTGATGFQPSATRNVFGNYNVTVVSTATIAGNASGTVVLEIAPTNSATAGDWVEIARFTNGQSLSLAITLQSVQTLAGQLSGMIPAGYYAKIRSINNAGTPTYTYNSGQEVLL